MSRMSGLDVGKTPESFPVVKVTKISIEHAKAPRQDPDLGARFEVDRQLERQLGNAFSSLQSNARKAFKLEWEGSNIPRVAVVDGKTIAWTQNGQVLDAEGRFVGTYERTVQSGGDSGKQQEMLVFVL